MRSRLPLNNLNTFAAAAECLSFQEAAERLGVSPSAVSHQVRNLEALLDYKLFDRLDKRVELTSRGQQLFDDLKEPIRLVHEASRKALRGHEDNNLTLSVAPVFATRWLLPRLRYFSLEHPEINVSMLATTDVVDLQSEHIDAAIRLGKGHWARMKSELLFQQQIVAVCRPSMLEEVGSSFAPKQLLEQPLLHNSSMEGLWDEWFSSVGVTPEMPLGGIVLQNSAQILEAVYAGGGVGLMDRAFIQDDLREGKLALAHDRVFSGDEGFYLVYPESTAKQSVIRSFSDWLFSQLGSE